MSKLFVITYKRPAVSIEKITMEIDQAYDCESAHTEELAQIKLKDAQNKYEDVEMFECEDYEYVEFMKNDEAVAHFTRTGEHSMKPIEGMDEGYEPPFALWVLDGDDNKWKMYKGMESDKDFNKDEFLAQANKREFPNETQLNNYIDAKIVKNGTVVEDVEVGTESHTETLHLILEMTRLNESTPFDYHVDIDDVGQIVFTPDDSSVSFVDIERLAGYDSVEDVIDGNTRRFSVTLTANMIADDDNFEWFCDIDEIGQAVVTPDAENTSFLSVSVADSLNLVTESMGKIVLETLEPGSEEFNTRLQECAERVTTLQGLFESAIEIAEDIENDFRALGCHSADIDGYMIRYLENFIEDREGEVSCAEFVRRLEEVSSSTTDTDTQVEEAVEPVNEGNIVLENDVVMEKVDELDRHNIVDRFMKGDIGIFSEEGEPLDSYIHLDELDTVSGKTAYKYYYDEESDAVVCYSSKALKNER